MRERRRLAAVERLGILDSGPDRFADGIVELAVRLLAAPIAVMSFVDADREWLRGRVGIDRDHLPRSESWWAGLVDSDAEALVVGDAGLDPRSADSPLVTRGSSIRSGAAVPLRTSEGERVGLLGVFDRVPRSWTDGDVAALRQLADLIEQHLQQRELPGRVVDPKRVDPIAVGDVLPGPDWDAVAAALQWYGGAVDDAIGALEADRSRIGLLLEQARGRSSLLAGFGGGDPQERSTVTAAIAKLEEARRASRRELFRALQVEGASIGDISRMWGVSRQLVSRILNDERS
ncbi:MAG: hypothetical protein JWM34_1960 [Ilumatobacteraceae bacterium]|nr:hypothetical protein [Ilumatobacteraceae bacterium]